MSEKSVDLIGKVCPFCVMHIIREVGQMRSGESVTFYVDDPLAIKSVPEELEDDADVALEVLRKEKYWKIGVSKS